MLVISNLKTFFPYAAIIFLYNFIDTGYKITIINLLSKSFISNSLSFLNFLFLFLLIIPCIIGVSFYGYVNDKFSQTKIIRLISIVKSFFLFTITMLCVNGFFYAVFILSIIFGIFDAFFFPAKIAIIKKIVKSNNLGLANGKLLSISILAILLSVFIFTAIFEIFYTSADIRINLKSVWFIPFVLCILSVIQIILSFCIPIFEQSTKENTIKIKDFIKLRYLRKNFIDFYNQKSVCLSAVGIGLFIGLCYIVVTISSGHFQKIFSFNGSTLPSFIIFIGSVGMIFGALFSGNYCKNHIEIGLVPFGIIGVGTTLFLLAFSTSYHWVFLSSFLFGFAGSIFIVPLLAHLQFFLKDENSGQILAIVNFVQSLIILSCIFISILLLKLHSYVVFLMLGGVAIICAVYSIKLLPHLFARILTLPFVKLGYKVYVNGISNIPIKGGVLLLGNQVSFIDWLVLQIATPRPIKFAMHKTYYDIWYIRWFVKLFKVIPIGKGTTQVALKKIVELLENGEVVAMFPETHISYNGQIGEFQDDYLHVSSNSQCVVIPFYISGLWGSTFSRASTPKRGIFATRRRIGVTFGNSVDNQITPNKLKEHVINLSFFAFEDELKNAKPLQYNWLKNAKSKLFKQSIADTTGLELNNAKFLTLVLAFENKLKNILNKSSRIGILLPSSVVGSAINILVLIKGKIGVNLNYTLSPDILRQCVDKAEIKTIITSKQFIQKLAEKGFDIKELFADKFVFLEDIGKTISEADKKKAFLKAVLLPSFLIELLYFKKSKIDEEACILFSSGSEGSPKGIVLTHKNLLGNIIQIYTLLNSDKNEVILSSLPIFHSFGLLVTTYLPLCEGIKSIHVADPTDALNVGTMTAKYQATVMFGTSTFFRIYNKSKKLHPLMLKSIRIAISGAEKLNINIKNEFKIKFGVDIFEGYGTTETAPVISVNTPNVLEPESLKELKFTKLGSVGFPLPFTIIKIVDENTMQPLAINQKGLILIGGAQVMKGYFNDEDKTKKAITIIDNVRYYKTGDIGYIDDEGFLFITDRISRFAKIGGEMISLGMVEREIVEVLSEDDIMALVNLEDEKKGEKIVMLYVGEKSVDELKQLISSTKLTSIMKPSEIFIIDEIPILGTGKTDYIKAKKIARKLNE